MASKNVQARKWQITQNNPQDIELDLKKFIEKIKTLSPDYFCVCKEIADTGTPHFHGFIYAHSPKRFNTIKKQFPFAHIEKAYASCKTNRDYLLKEGKWEDDHKSHTKVEGSFSEEGVLPSERDEKHPELALLIERIKAGAATVELLEEFPQYALQTRNIEDLRTAYCGGVEKKKCRNLKITVIESSDEVDKISFIYEQFDFNDVCRITNYGRNKSISFDTYKYQKILVFENFNGQIPLDELSIYLSKYPVTLPARYGDRVACFDEAYILINRSLEEIYATEIRANPGLWARFSQGITKTIRIDSSGEIQEEISHGT